MATFFNRWLALALYISAGPILVFAHAFAGAGSQFTAIFTAGSTLALLLCSRGGDFALDPCDVLFGIFLGCIAVSFAINGKSGNSKEIVLLALSLSAYPAARLFAGSKTVSSSFLLFTALIVAAGAAVTVASIPAWWSANDGNPHPSVLGEFPAAPAQFTMSLGFLMIALVCVRLTNLLAATALAALLVPIAIFAASFVRLSFVAIGLALVVAALTSEGRQRRYAALMICVLIAGVIIGNIARLQMAPMFSKAATPSATLSQVEPAPHTIRQGPPAIEMAPAPTACPAIDVLNSIAIRRQLYRDAFSILPHIGLFGIGLDRFMTMSCIENTEIHNTILQVIVELGWIAGVVLVALLAIAGCSLWPLARRLSEARFALCGLIYIASLSMGHGIVSRDAYLYLFLGYAAGLRATCRRKSLSPSEAPHYRPHGDPSAAA